MNVASEKNVALKGDLENINKINKQMITTINILENESDRYCREAKLLRVELDHYRSEGDNMMGTNTDISKGSSFVHGTVPTVDNRPRLLLVAGGFGRGLVHFLDEQCNHTYRMQAVLKPNSSNTELIDTALEGSKYFSKDDIVIIWPFNLSSDFFGKFLMKTTHTNSLILTRPYGRGIEENNFIYESTLSLYKQLHYHELNLAGVFDVNSVLCGSNKFSFYTSKAKWMLARAVWRHLSDRLIVKPNGNNSSVSLLMVDQHGVSVGYEQDREVAGDSETELVKDGAGLEGDSLVQDRGDFFRQ